MVVVVVNGEIPREAGGGRLATQKPGAKGMKRGNPRLRRTDTGPQQQVRDAIAHLFRSLVGKGYSEDGFRRHTIRDQIGHAVSNGARLARSGASEDQHRSFGRLYGKPLFWIQFVEKSEHLSAAFEKGMHTSW